MKSALVTGASRGIGLGIARELATRGFGLTISSRSADELSVVRAELEAAGAPRVVTVPADLADEQSPGLLVGAHDEAFGALDALVLSGGVGTAGPLELLSRPRVEKTFKVNVLSAATLVQHALPLLRTGATADPATGARVIAVASITGVHAEAGLAAYGASKAALISLMETLNVEEAPNGVMATAIAPGYVRTAMSEWVTDRIPADTMIPVSDVVAVVRLLLELGSTTSLTRVVMTRSAGSQTGA